MTTAQQHFGLNDLDRALSKYVDFDSGVYFEAGANDGLNQSNTAYFEFHRGWTGVLVEPIHFRCRQCFHNRPRSRVFWGALVANAADEPSVEIRYCDLMTVTRKEGLLVDAEAHVATGTQFLFHEEPRTMEAPTRTISGVLAEAGVRRVDLFSLDIEGFEVEALRGLDLDAFDIRHLCIETSKPEAVAAILGERYAMELKLTSHDYLFTKRL